MVFSPIFGDAQNQKLSHISPHQAQMISLHLNSPKVVCKVLIIEVKPYPSLMTPITTKTNPKQITN